MNEKTYSPLRLLPLTFFLSGLFIQRIGDAYLGYFTNSFMRDTGIAILKTISFTYTNINYYAGFILVLYFALFCIFSGFEKSWSKFQKKYLGIYDQVKELYEDVQIVEEKLKEQKRFNEAIASRHLKLEANLKALTGYHPDEQDKKEKISQEFTGGC